MSEFSDFDGHEAPLQREVFLGSPKTPDLHELLRALSDATGVIRSKDEQIVHGEHDPLTGMLRREAFQREAERFHERMQRGREEHGEDRATLVIFVDLNKFKPVNDKFGHAAGDMTLNRAAQSLIGRTRPGDLWGRVGGDEFACVLSRGLSEDDDMEDFINRFERNLSHDVSQDIRQALQEWLGMEDPEQGVSVGIVEWELGQSFDDALAAADRRMLEQKPDNSRAE